MKQSTQAGNRVSLIFRAVADRTRLRILHLLLEGELCVCDIVKALRLKQAATSRHLAYLRKARLVTVRKTGLWSYYALAPAQEPLHAKLLECLGCCFAEVPEIQADTVRVRKIKESRSCCPKP
jgi:ArsR family transcriptional regulator